MRRSESHPSFGAVLRALAKAEYRTLDAFAAKVGLSPGRVSHLTTNRDPNVSFATLELLLDALPSLDQKQRLYTAWLAQHAPAPVTVEPPDATADDEAILTYLDLAPTLLAHGQIRAVLTGTGQLWRALLPNDQRWALAWRVGQRYVDACYLADHRPPGLGVLRQMRERAIQRYEPAIVGATLYLEAVGLRPVVGAVAADRQLDALSAYLRDWQPRNLPEQTEHANCYSGLVRDRVLFAWDLIRAGTDCQGELRQRLATFQANIKLLENGQDIAICREVGARALTVLGKFDEAHEALAEATAQPTPDHPIHLLKAKVTLARLLMAEGESESVEGLLEEALMMADQGHFHHYLHEISVIQRRRAFAAANHPRR